MKSNRVVGVRLQQFHGFTGVGQRSTKPLLGPFRWQHERHAIMNLAKCRVNHRAARQASANRRYPNFNSKVSICDAYDTSQSFHADTPQLPQNYPVMRIVALQDGM